MLQRTDSWFKKREGRFTASRISELLTKGMRKMTENELKIYKEENPKGRRTTIDIVGDSLKTYALEMAVEEKHGYNSENNFVSYDMQRGINLEPVAFQYFKQQMQLEFLEVTEVGFAQYENSAGASGDGYVSDNSGLEIKCPGRTNYFKVVVNGIDEIDSKYIDQMQMQMLATGTDRTYFFLYYEEKNKQFGHTIIIDRDEERIEFIKSRITVATEFKKDFLNKLNKNEQ